MDGLLVLLVLLLVGLLISALVQWVVTASQLRRVMATQSRLRLLEDQHRRRLDVLSGRIGRLEMAGVTVAPEQGESVMQPADAAVPIEPAVDPIADSIPEPSASSHDKPAPVSSEQEAAKPVAPGQETIASLLRVQAQTRAAMEAKADREAAESVEGDSPHGTAQHDAGADAPADSSTEIASRDEEVADVTPIIPPRVDELASRGPIESTPKKLPPVHAVEKRSGLSALSFEQLLGGKVFVWLGAIALVLTGVFLLKYGFEHHYITIEMRVIAAGVFGGVLIGVAYGLRHRSPGIAEAVCAAGVAVLFGTIYAGQNLYDLIQPGWGYSMLVAVAVAAVVLSLRFGPLVALLGLVGGFALPPLLGGDLPGRPAMVMYLLALEVGVLAVTRKRGWIGISALTLLGAVIWTLSYVLLGGGAVDRGFTAALVLATSVIFILNATFAQGRKEQVGSKARQVLWLALGAAGSSAALLSLFVTYGGYNGQDMALLWVMVAGSLVLARLDARYMPVAWVSAGLSAVVVLGAGGSAWWQARASSAWVESGTVEPAVQSALAALRGGALAFGLLVGLACYAGQWWTTRRRAFAWLSASAGPVFLGAAVLGSGWLLGYRVAWWPWSLGAAFAYALAAGPLVWRGRSRHGWPGVALEMSEDSAQVKSSGIAGFNQSAGDAWSASAYALVSVALAAIAIGQGLAHPWIAVSWAMLAAVSGVVGWRLRLNVLTFASGALAVLSAVMLVVPGPFDVEIVGGVVFNNLLAVYVLAACAYGVVAYAAHRAGRSDLSRPIQSLCVGALAVGCVVLVRNGFHETNFVAESLLMYEWPTYAVVLLALGLGTVVLSRRLGLMSVGLVAMLIALLGACLAVIGPVVFGNPLTYSDAGGVALMWGMLYLYVLPAVLVFVLARVLIRAEEDGVARVMRVLGIGLVCVFVVMQVRNGFNLADLHCMRIRFDERAMYGPALLALAWLLFSYSRVFGSVFARQAGRIVAAIGMAVSLGIMVLVGNPLVDPWLAGGRWLVVGLCYAYLLPAAMGWGYARVIDREATRRIGRFLRLGAMALITVFVGLQVRNGFHADNLHAFDVTRIEWATYGLCWMLLGAVFAAAGRWLIDRPLLQQSGMGVAGLGLATAILGTVLIDNPLWTHASVGTQPIANALWYLYGPAIFALAILARRLRLEGKRAVAHAAGGGAIALGFLLLCLLVRQGFNLSGDLHLVHHANVTEWYAYSLAWVVFGVGLLVAGVWSGLDTLRFGSLAVMLLTVAKVFALDTAELSGLLRVFSFLGLGITLLLLGYTYQRFVFRKPDSEDETPTVDRESTDIQA